jgi:glycosyltransferase involved in cell wall biosynthesis
MSPTESTSHGYLHDDFPSPKAEEQSAPHGPAIRPPKLSVVMPVFNERATIEEIISRVQAIDIDKEIVIIDDGSRDGSKEFLVELAHCAETDPPLMNLPGRKLRVDNIRVFFQERNSGKGAAVRRGFEEALGDLVIVQDADLELDPQDYYQLIKPLERGLADVVYGSRFLGKTRQGSITLYYLGNRFLTALSNLITGLHVTDVWVGYKVFRRDVLRRIRLREDRFGFEPEVTAKIAKLACRVVEVPVSYTARSREDGKKIGWRDAVRGVWCTLRYTIIPDSTPRQVRPKE